MILSVIGTAGSSRNAAIATRRARASGRCSEALIAREPAERRPTIDAWLPAGFLPPQVAVVSATPSARSIRVRMLGSNARVPPLSSRDILFWRNDAL